MTEPYKFSTQLIKNTVTIDPVTGASNLPIYLASTFHQKDFDHYGKYDYSRSGNPTRDALETAIAKLEAGVRGFAFSSGMAAISTAFLLFSAGDHVIVPRNVYGGTYRLVTEILNRLQISHTFVDTTHLAEIEEAIQPNTKVIYLETPSNPTLCVTDIQAVSELAKAHRCLTFVDNTFMTPVYQQPLQLGADLVLHSATKFLSGHSDVVAGLAVAANNELADRLYFLQNAMGAVLGIQDSWLLLRGMKTVAVRMKQASDSALRIAEFLEQQPEVRTVYYPGLASHPQTDLQKKQARSGGAVLSFELEDENAARAFANAVTLPLFAVSLGAVESILSYPPKMSHAELDQAAREKSGIASGLLRLSVGLEDAGDLIHDLSIGLAHTHHLVRNGQ